MATYNVVDRFIELLEADAKRFDDMATNLEELMPRLAGEQQKAWARAEIARRRGQASMHRELAELTKIEHGQ